MDLLDLFSNVNGLVIVFYLILPGFISIKAYEVLVPSPRRNWGDSIIEALIFGSINFVVVIPLLNAANSCSIWLGYLLWVISLFALPIVWAVLFYKIPQWKFFKEFLRNPCPTAWDGFLGSENVVGF